MIALRRRCDAILRGHPSRGSWAVVLGCGLAYGGVMGLFGGRVGQVAYSAIKVPLLLGATLVLSLPSYFVLNTLFGLRADFAAAWRAVVASQAGLTIILVSLAPITAFWYASSSNYRSAILFNTLMFGVASLGGAGHPPPQLRPPDRPRPEAPLPAPGVDLPLRVRRGPDGLEPPAVHRVARRAGQLLPRRGVGERLSHGRPVVVGGCDWPAVGAMISVGRRGRGRGDPGCRWCRPPWRPRARRTG